MDDYLIEEPVKETITGFGGTFTKGIKIYRKKLTVRDYKKLALNSKYKNPRPNLTLLELERLIIKIYSYLFSKFLRFFWKNILFGEPIYGADTDGSIYDKDVKEFNMNNLGTILDLLRSDEVKNFTFILVNKRIFKECKRLNIF